MKHGRKARKYIRIPADRVWQMSNDGFTLTRKKKLKTDRPHPRAYLTHRQTHWTDKESSLLCAALGKAEPLGQMSNDSNRRAWTR